CARSPYGYGSSYWYFDVW
nr:immunoglobulin heavy chain junction region [Mus musculus]NSM03839.1 immunoglobulin heavy chain junction region [Mus musculus]NSM03854.1 immunoglobulin heavy chain junction region [Mus musculus]NSM04452.1 immunoglobulin heavy chain junction region [Mus musculus]NSM05033.1 immunoglobulin heavy chain junction region [Mus musculus]